MPKIDTVTPNDVFSEKADAVVIGAGIAGLSTALELIERGLQVVILEKGEVACEQSSRNWGWCRQMGRDPREIPLIQVALNKWRGMNKRIGAETGFRQCGIAYFSGTDAEMEARERWHKSIAAPHKLSTRLLTSKDAAALAPGCLRAWIGGIYTPDDGRAEPFMAVPAMARAAQAWGSKVFTNCAARGLEMEAGRVSGVVTEKGTIKTDTVVLAGGYWSRRFLGNLDLTIPQLGVVNSVMRTAARETGINHTFAGHKYAVRKRLDGGFTITHNHFSVAEVTPAHVRHYGAFGPLRRLERSSIKVKMGRRFIHESMLKRRWKLDETSPFEKVRILDPAPYTGILDEAMAALQRDFPAYQSLPVAERWGGMIDAMPDAVPVIDKVEPLPGLFLATGFSGHGFGLGPGAGQLMAEIITGGKTCVDPRPFKLSRFFDGSRPMPATGV